MNAKQESHQSHAPSPVQHAGFRPKLCTRDRPLSLRRNKMIKMAARSALTCHSLCWRTEVNWSRTPAAVDVIRAVVIIIFQEQNNTMRRSTATSTHTVVKGGGKSQWCEALNTINRLDPSPPSVSRLQTTTVGCVLLSMFNFSFAPVQCVCRDDSRKNCKNGA